MTHDKPVPADDTPDAYAWFRDGSVPPSREDRIAEVLAVIALVFSLCIGVVIALLPVPAKAATVAEAAAPSLQREAFKILPAQPGHAEQRVPATQAHAGDQLEYQAVYRNPTAATLHHVSVTVPVPRDGKQFAPLPLLRVETAIDGRRVSRPAPGADYRFLRWDLGDVPAGATRTVRARVQLVSTTVAAR